MSDDIVKRLVLRRGFSIAEDYRLMDEAAAEIERLRDALRAERDAHEGTIEVLVKMQAAHRRQGTTNDLRALIEDGDQ